MKGNSYSISREGTFSLQTEVDTILEKTIYFKRGDNVWVFYKAGRQAFTFCASADKYASERVNEVYEGERARWTEQIGKYGR